MKKVNMVCYAYFYEYKFLLSRKFFSVNTPYNILIQNRSAQQSNK